jgi:hypothetical protein
MPLPISLALNVDLLALCKGEMSRPQTRGPTRERRRKQEATKTRQRDETKRDEEKRDETAPEIDVKGLTGIDDPTKDTRRTKRQRDVSDGNGASRN